MLIRINIVTAYQIYHVIINTNRGKQQSINILV